MTSCGTCHHSYLSFSAGGGHVGASGDSNKPFRDVPRLMNVAYDTVLTWDGHIQTLEEQVGIAVQKKGDLNGDTTKIFPILASNLAYQQMFTRAFGDQTITLDRIAKAVATFERCLISGNSPYDQYVNGDTSAMSASAIRGMNLFFDTAVTKCAECHNNRNTTTATVPGNIFSDGNYYRTGTFEAVAPGGGGYYRPPTPTDSAVDPGRAAVTGDTDDIGKFRTPSLRNVALVPTYGSDANITSLAQVIANYNAGGNGTFQTGGRPFNQDPRIKPLNLTQTQQEDLESFLNSLTDLSFISNPAFQDPGAPTASVDDHIIAGNLSVYPNPASSLVTVESPELTGTTQASLISAGGVTVWRQTLNADGRPFQLDFTGIENGAYLLELKSGGAQETANIILRR
jgi:cytochrome c peroxidase